MAESKHIKDNGPAQKPTTEKHGTEPPNVTINEIMDNLCEYLDKRLGLRKCQDDICKKYGIKQSENGLWDLQDIKRVYGKTQRLRMNIKRDGLSVILGKQIRQHLQKCETDKLHREINTEKAKVQALAEQLRNEKKDKERLLNDNDKLLKLLSIKLGSKDCFEQRTPPLKSSTKDEKESLYPFKELKKIEDQQHRYQLGESDNSSTGNSDDSDVEPETNGQVTKENKMIRLAPVIVKNRRTEIEVDNEEQYEEGGEIRTRVVKKTVKKYIPHKIYHPASPEQDKWSKELPDVYKQPRKVWQVIQRLQKIYTLHPLDGAVILNINLRDSDQKKLTESVETRVGESQENIKAGWEAVKTFLFELKPAEVNWAKITSCMQKTGESVAEFEERFVQTWLEHSGLNDSADLDKDTSMPLKTAFVNGLKPETSKAIKIRYDDWDSVGTAFNQIVEWSAKIERTHEVKLRTLQSGPLAHSTRTMGNDVQENGGRRYTYTKPQRQGKYCNKEGHWFRECKLRLRDEKDGDDLEKRFRQLTQEQKHSLLKAVEPQGN